MIPVVQTKVVIKNSNGDIVQRGNCYAACIASLMELPITEVPNVEIFFKWGNDLWQETMMAFLELSGWELYINQQFDIFHHPLDKHFDDDEYKAKALEYCKDKFYLVSGISVRGVMHMCIFKNGELIHDPHPTREGLRTCETFQELIKKK